MTAYDLTAYCMEEDHDLYDDSGVTTVSWKVVTKEMSSVLSLSLTVISH